ncbi:hypothetical protein BC829DRAFT_393798, partial [Chytridium lagenaria]
IFTSSPSPSSSSAPVTASLSTPPPPSMSSTASSFFSLFSSSTLATSTSSTSAQRPIHNLPPSPSLTPPPPQKPNRDRLLPQPMILLPTDDYLDDLDSLLDTTPPRSVTAKQPRSTAMVTKQTQVKTLERMSEMVLDLKVSADRAAEIVETGGGEGSAANAGAVQLRGLLEHSKRMVVQLRGLMGVEGGFELREDNGELPSYDQLVSRLNDAFRNQREINSINIRLMSVNYMVNLSNFAKNRNMQRSIARGKRQILELQSTISKFGGLCRYKRTAERLKEALDSTRGLLESAVYRQELGRQGEIIKKQQSVMGDVHQNKMNQDFIVDSTLFVFCLWLVNTFAIEYPLQGKLWAKQAGKSLLLFFLLRRLRMGAAYYGLHHRVGSAVPYASTAFGIFVSACSQALGISMVTRAVVS